jgi:hypothetical protein
MLNRLTLTGFGLALLAALTPFVWHRFSPDAHYTNSEIYSMNGARLTSFFHGLPVDPQFKGGRNAFTSVPKRECGRKSENSSLGLWFKALFGTVVHAQDSCNGCYVKILQVGCGQGCGDSTQYAQANGGGSVANTGSVYDDDSSCTSACNISNQTTCTSTGCGGGGGDGGCDTDCCDGGCDYQ